MAGIAHELNTPLGNGVMAVSTMRAALSSFQVESAQGLKRSHWTGCGRHGDGQ